MKALHVVRPATGGMKEQVLRLCLGLRERGWTVELACPPDSPILAEAGSWGFEVHVLDLVGPLDPVRDVRAIRRLATLVREGRHDVVHAHGFKAGLVGRVGATLGGCRRRLLTVHNHVLYREDITAFTKWRYRTVERLLARWTERVIAVSDSIRTELVDAYHVPSELVVTVHNGIDLPDPPDPATRSASRTRMGVDSEELLVGTACRFAPQKDLGTLVRAAARVSEARKDVRFVIGGDGPLRPEIETQVFTRGLDGVVFLVGDVVDMPAFLAGLDVYVSSSLSEGLPLGLIEASGACLPIVATEVGGTPEIVHDSVSGVLVPARDDERLAGALLAVLDDASARRRMGAAGRRIAATEFAIPRMIDESVAVYDALR